MDWSCCECHSIHIRTFWKFSTNKMKRMQMEREVGRWVGGGGGGGGGQNWSSGSAFFLHSFKLIGSLNWVKIINQDLPYVEFLLYVLHISYFQNFLNNLKDTNVMAFVARIGLFFQMLCVFPLLVYILRLQFMNSIFGTTWPRWVIFLNYDYRLCMLLN